MKKVLIMLSILLCMFATVPAFAAETKDEIVKDVKSAVLIERDTGKVLYDKNAHQRLAPASMTKIMTMLLIMQALNQGSLNLNEEVQTSEYAASMGGSQIFLEPGEKMKVNDMLKGIAIGSANDAAVAMAERIAGSEKAFVKLMNEKAASLGLKDTKFQNVTGLPVKDHYSSAYDMSVMAKTLLKYPQITNYTGRYEAYIRENTDKKFWLVNTNKLVKYYDGVDGLKTGFTNEAKFCLTATAKKDNMRVIAVVFGAPSTKVRNAQVTKLLDYAFNQYQVTPLYKQGQVVGSVKVSKGNKRKIQALTSEPVSVLTKKGEKVGKLKTQIEYRDMKAPIKQGQTIGTLTVRNNKEVLQKIDLVSKQNVKPANWWQLWKTSFGMFSKS